MTAQCRFLASELRHIGSFVVILGHSLACLSGAWFCWDCPDSKSQVHHVFLSSSYLVQKLGTGNFVNESNTPLFFCSTPPPFGDLGV
jgi:hypothetical protein